MRSSFGHVLFLITWYNDSTNIKRGFSFVLVPRHRCSKLQRVHLNSHVWLSILPIESLIFKHAFFPWSVLFNFTLNKCHSHTKISDYFGSYSLVLIKKVVTKNLKFLLFPTYVPVTLIRSKLQIHPANPTHSYILKFITEFL